MHIFACTYAKDVDQTWGVRQTCIHELRHVCILTKVCEQKIGDLHINAVPHKGKHFHITMKRRWNRLGELDKYSCTDDCTNSNQGIGSDEGLLGHIHGATQGHRCLCSIMQMG